MASIALPRRKVAFIGSAMLTVQRSNCASFFIFCITIESGHATLAHHEASRVRDAAYELLQLEGGDLHDPAQTRQTDAATPAAFRMGMLSIDNFPSCLGAGGVANFFIFLIWQPMA
jgi:hypothetical protein